MPEVLYLEGRSVQQREAVAHYCEYKQSIFLGPFLFLSEVLNSYRIRNQNEYMHSFFFFFTVMMIQHDLKITDVQEERAPKLWFNWVTVCPSHSDSQFYTNCINKAIYFLQKRECPPPPPPLYSTSSLLKLLISVCYPLVKLCTLQTEYLLSRTRQNKR